MKIALLFSGQGAQYPGMGRDLYEHYPESKEIFDQAGDKIRSLCFEGTKEELAKTENTQPCVYTMTMAVYAALKKEMDQKNYTISALAGFSLGEYAALTAGGLFSFHDGLQLVTKRGQWMEAAASGKGSMVASLGEKEKTEALVCKLEKRYTIQAVNYNCPGQIVVAGETEAISAYQQQAGEYGLKCIPLAVSGPFHSTFLTPVVEQLHAELDRMDLGELTIPVVSNVTGTYMKGDLKELISKQVASPVRWESSIRFLIGEGFDTFIEVGPGKTLAGLCKKIDRTKGIHFVENMETLNKVLGAL